MDIFDFNGDGTTDFEEQLLGYLIINDLVGKTGEDDVKSELDFCDDPEDC